MPSGLWCARYYHHNGRIRIHADDACSNGSNNDDDIITAVGIASTTEQQKS